MRWAIFVVYVYHVSGINHHFVSCHITSHRIVLYCEFGFAKMKDGWGVSCKL